MDFNKAGNGGAVKANASTESSISFIGSQSHSPKVPVNIDDTYFEVFGLWRQKTALIGVQPRPPAWLNLLSLHHAREKNMCKYLSVYLNNFDIAPSFLEYCFIGAEVVEVELNS